MKKCVLLLSLFILVGCTEKLNQQHEQFLNDFGWSVKKLSETNTINLETPEEIVENYEASGIDFIREFQGQEVTEYQYELQEKDQEKNAVKAIILEVNGEIIGGYLLLTSWTPGVFKLVDKEHLINEEYVRP